MAVDLKPIFDAAQAADAEVQRILGEMNTAFQTGTEEGRTQAMGLKPALEQAKAKAKDANDLYTTMRDASAVSDSAPRKFVPAGAAPVNLQGGQPVAKEMQRADFLALDSATRMTFIKGGGIVLD